MSEAEIKTRGDEVVATPVHDGVCIVHERMFIYIVNNDLDATYIQLVNRPGGTQVTCNVTSLGDMNKFDLDLAVELCIKRDLGDKAITALRAIYMHMFKPAQRFMGPTRMAGDPQASQ